MAARGLKGHVDGNLSHLKFVDGQAVQRALDGNTTLEALRQSRPSLDNEQTYDAKPEHTRGFDGPSSTPTPAPRRG